MGRLTMYNSQDIKELCRDENLTVEGFPTETSALIVRIYKFVMLCKHAYFNSYSHSHSKLYQLQRQSRFTVLLKMFNSPDCIA